MEPANTSRPRRPARFDFVVMIRIP